MFNLFFLQRSSLLEKIILIALAFIAFPGSSLVQAKSQFLGEYLFFPQSQAYYQSIEKSGDDSKKSDAEAGVDFFFSAEYGYLRALGEIVVSTEETDIERLQIGLSIRPGATVWAGRYHNPVGYWNQQFHHGSFLQTTISRPAIVEFIDNGGILPLHIAGLYAELDPKEGGAGFYLKVGVGFGPALDIEAEHTLEELNILTPSEEHGLSFAARLSYRPDDFKPDEFGLFYNRSHIKREYAIEPIIEITQSIYGIFSYFGAGPFIFTGSFFAVENDFNVVPGGNEIDLFVSGYLQAETVWRSDWIFFVRGEGMQSDNDDRYLALFPEFEKERFVGGIRYEITKHQAVKVELSNILKRNERFNRVAIQWSSVFP